jgi:outer membrane protein assembly factor BamB
MRGRTRLHPHTRDLHQTGLGWCQQRLLGTLAGILFAGAQAVETVGKRTTVERMRSASFVVLLLGSLRGEAPPSVLAAPQIVPANAAIPWHWDGVAFCSLSSRQMSTSLSVQHTASDSGGTTRCEWLLADLATTLTCRSGQRELWHHREENHEFLDDAALAMDAGTVYVAVFSRIASGCLLTALDTATGRKRWSSFVGLGEIAHSAYANCVQLEVIAGRPVVFGWESGGRYVEALDPAAGTTKEHHVLPPI